MLITFYDSYNILTKVYSGGMFIKQAMNETVIEEKNRSLVTKICYGVLDKDITLSYIISELCDKNPKLAVRTILKISLYNIIYLKKAPYAVTDNAVELIKKLGKGGMSGFVNSLLRRYIKEGVKEPQDKIKLLSYRYSYPEWAVKKLLKDYPLDTAEKIMAYDSENTYIRFNNGIDGGKYLDEKNIRYENTAYDGLYKANGFKMDDGFYDGKYTFQSIGSVAICKAVGEGELLLDACSAPGGKAVLLSDSYKSVTAFEVHEHRVNLIKQYALRMHKDNITAEQRDSSIYDENLKEKFDAVLCDVPCSGFGVLKENPDIKLQREEKNIGELILLQKSILDTCSKYVKHGGILVYSTCSVFRDENDRQIEKFLKDHSDFEEVKTECDVPYESYGHGIALLPHISDGGFYYAKLRRI